MKLGIVACIAGFALALAACTVQKASPSEATDVRDGESPLADAGAGSTDAAASGDSKAPASEVPADLTGVVWSWVTSSGGTQLEFEADGSYTTAVFLNAHPGESCGVEYFTHRSGAATFDGDSLTLSSTLSKRTKKDSCKDAVLSEETIDEVVATYRWVFERDDSGEASLTLTDDKGVETRYTPE